MPRSAHATRLAFALTLGALALAATACSDGAAHHHQALLLDGRLTSSAGGGRLEETFCSDEQHLARRLCRGEVLSAVVEMGREPRLALSGCLRRTVWNRRPPGPGVLHVEISRAGAEAPPLDIPLGERGWFRRELELPALAGGTAHLRLSAEPPKGWSLYLDEVDLADRRPAPRRHGRPRQVLLVSLDTFRADAIGALGGNAATPNLDRLLGEGELFSPHYAGATWTKPSHGSLLTGELPEVHGATGFDSPLRTGLPTLAERFRAAGFLTAGLVYDCGLLDARSGFARGYDTYRAVRWNVGPETRWAASWMIEHRDDPFFFFLHTYETHEDARRLPYESPGTSRYTVETRFGFPYNGCRQGFCAGRLLSAINVGLAPLPREAEVLRFLYDRSVEHVDSELGRFFDELRQAGLYDDMLIAVTSDHGEAFLEHGRVSHGSPWQEVLRVPLIIKWPGGARAGERVATPSSSLDVAPTLLAAAGIAAPDLPGTDLATHPAPRPVFFGSGWRGVVVDGIKGDFGFDGGPPRLYDLAADPNEEHDLATSRPDLLQRLQVVVAKRRERDRRRLARLGTAAPSSLSDEEIERLRALGYAGAGKNP